MLQTSVVTELGVKSVVQFLGFRDAFVEQEDSRILLIALRVTDESESYAVAFRRAVQQVLTARRGAHVLPRHAPELTAVSGVRPRSGRVDSECGQLLPQVIDSPAERLVLRPLLRT